VDRLVSDGRRLRAVPISVPVDGELVALDEVSFTFSEHKFRRIGQLGLISDVQVVHVVASELLKPIFGFLPTDKMQHGLHGYKEVWRLGEFGLIACGGNNRTVYVRISGHGCACAVDGWQQRLYEFFIEHDAQLTRIDFAYDDFEGKTFPVRRMLQEYRDGESFRSGRGLLPKIETRGDWERDDPDGKGLTLYIGSYDSARLIRIYEKSKQLGDRDGQWVRFEVQLRNSTLSLVPEMLIRPTGFFVGTFPICARIGWAGLPSQTEYRVRTSIANVEKAIAIIRNQYGVYLHILRSEFFGSDAELLQAVCRVGKVPASLQKAIDLHDRETKGSVSQKITLAESDPLADQGFDRVIF